jgi:hypothetical protein
MSDANLIRLCKLPSDLGMAAGRELYLDPAAWTFYVGGPAGPAESNGAAGPRVALTDFLKAHPDVCDALRAFLVGRLTGHPKAFEEENRERLKGMLAGVTDENRHEEVDWGPPVGREVW